VPGAYEQLAYPGYAYASTHPARLEVVGRLFGLSAAPAAGARILELGCGDGGNALSIAQSLPGASVVGIDLEATAIERGRRLAEAAGLDNAELRCGDIEDPDAGEEPFDYLIAHGVYSWVPPRARGALLERARRCLAPGGIAFISFNAYPGSYLRDMTRDILRYHVRDVADPQRRLAEAQELMRTIVSVEDPSPFARVLREHMERMLEAADALLFHDDLAEVSTPFYFHEVVEHAGLHGLRFLAEADLSESLMRDVPEGVEALVRRLPDDFVVREQYLDFFKNRMFRQTLFCHAEAPVSGAIDAAALSGCWFSSSARPGEDVGDDDAETFTTDGGYTVTTSEPLVRAALHALAESWPAAVAFADLLERSVETLGRSVPAELVADRLQSVLLEAYLSRVVSALGCPPPVTPKAGPRPRASGLARAQRAAGAPAVASLLHTNVVIGDPDLSAALGLADGMRERADFAEALPDPGETLDRLAALGLLQAEAVD
jgi:SAM-dependent methyltransferase